MWGVPVDHEMFNDINTAQWLWYYHNMVEDNTEEFESHRDMIEYHASFIEPEAVNKIRRARDDSIEVSHDDFTAGIEQAFGRKIDIGREKRKSAATNVIKKNPNQSF